VNAESGLEISTQAVDEFERDQNSGAGEAFRDPAFREVVALIPHRLLLPTWAQPMCRRCSRAVRGREPRWSTLRQPPSI
jgi:hypothetical protein